MQVKIEKLVYGGDGLGHADGHTVFVPFVLPGEDVRIRPVQRKKRFVRGRVAELVEPSPERAAAPCPYFGVCGGCHYQHIPYPAQLRYKTEILRETLRRIGRIDWTGEIRTHASPSFGYRNRAQWKVRPVGSGTSGKRALALGYFEAGTSAFCPVETCPVLSPLLEHTLATLREMGATGELPNTLCEVEAYADTADERLLLNLSLTEFPSSPAAFAETLCTTLSSVESVLLHESSRDRFELFGPGYLTCPVAGHAYRVGHLSFFQVNRFLTEAMVAEVASGASGELALDLFAGVGLFAVPLAQRFIRVVAVESNAAAARDLEANLSSCTNAQVVCADVETCVTGFSKHPSLVVLDPPRAGVSPECLNRIIALAPDRITYVSCDPATLARDLQRMVASHYAIRELHLFDVFPQSFHIESLVRLVRQ